MSPAITGFLRNSFEKTKPATSRSSSAAADVAVTPLTVALTPLVVFA